MKILAICRPRTPAELAIIDQMHRLRARIFKGRLSWNVHCVDGREYDEFDDLSPTYIVASDSRNCVVGCARLLPSLGTTMLQSVFPQLLKDGRLPSHGAMVESSRFCVDTECVEGRVDGALHGATSALFAGIVEWSMANGYSEIATATDVKFERILNRAGWPMRRLGEPTMINETRSVAGVLIADETRFRRLRPSQYHSTFLDLQQKVA